MWKFAAVKDYKKSKKCTAVEDHMLFVIILYLLATLKFWQPETQISILRSKKVF